MRGNFDNSPENLSTLGPTRWSTEATAKRIASGLQTWTGKKWVVTLHMKAPNAGGFFVEPLEKRRNKEGKMSRADWQSLHDVLGVVPFIGGSRYYILPDEVTHVLNVLEKKGPTRQRRMTKLDQVESDLFDDEST
jgi:hypothetical protein